ncbi:TIR domain-containing protein [Pelotomaculum propionicicum]|uniref:TIR domain-containing protein n=1 Tax=Pelotomaculum propionicicum TaxID=258475 RepID=UPI003B7ACE83
MFRQHESIVRKQAEYASKNEPPKPHPLPDASEEKIEDGQVKTQYIQTAEHAAVIIELPQAEIKKELETEEQQKVTAVKQEDLKAKLQPYKNKVLIIHGDNEKIRKSLRNFLLSLGLQAVEWAEDLLMAEKPDPDHSDVIRVALEQCQAAVVILTNDKQDMTFPDEEPGLRFLPQAELNGLFIAGMAAAIDRHRTVVAGLGNPVPFHSIPGLYITDLDNTLEKRKAFIERLRAVGCEIKTKGKAWQISGDFDIDLKPVFAEKQPPSQPVDIEPVKETQAPQIQPETVPHETVGRSDEDKSLEKPQAEGSAKIEPDIKEQPTRSKSLIESLPLISILRTKKQPKKEKPAPEKATQPQPREKVETILKELKTTTPVAKKHPQKKQEPLPPAQQPKPEHSLKKEQRHTASPEARFEPREPQKPIKEPTLKKAELYPDENDFYNRIKELEGKLEALKNRGGRLNQRAVDELEKQIQAEKYRLRTIQQLANIENLKKSYEDYNKKGKKEDK